MTMTMTRDTAATRLSSSPATRIATLIARLAAALAREIRIHRDMRLLSTFDDAALRDIGLARGGVENAVRNGRARGKSLGDFDREQVNSAGTVIPQPLTEWR
ncbi:DUF1127 domain-containing protein [Microvirga sp. 2MCAF38]|uniref:DUF1127 domain-containing protein n=1 Tax=Microvirga sp. 2MCAF38 TaxID=3232989 RepID=UPI003F97ACE3